MIVHSQNVRENVESSADQIHVLLSCSYIWIFWRELVKIISKVLCFIHNYLGNMPDGLSKRIKEK